MKNWHGCAPTETTSRGIDVCSKPSSRNLERQFIERRLSEEQSDFERLAAGTFPVTFTLPVPPEPATSHDTTAEVSGGWPSVTPPSTRA